MPYKVMDIWKDLPKTNCGECGKAGCLPFATAVFFEGFALSACPHLPPGKLSAMEDKLAAERGAGSKKPAVEQALVFLMEKTGGMEFKDVASRAGVEYAAGPPESLRLVLFHLPYRVTAKAVTAEKGEDPSASVKVLLLIYLTRARGSVPSGDWVAFRDFPDTVSKSKSFEEAANRLAGEYSGRMEELEIAAEKIGAEPGPGGTADRDFIFQALPRVPVRVLFWDGDEDFAARASYLLDRTAFDYLDQEAMVFLAEALTALLIGEGLDDLVA